MRNIKKLWNEMDAEDVCSKYTQSMKKTHLRKKKKMSGTSNKNEGRHLAEPGKDQCEKKETCF